MTAMEQANPNVLDVLEIEKVVDGASGLARDAHGVVLVPGTLPGESVEVADMSGAKGVRTARVTRVLRPSPERIPAGCPLFLTCGGCDFLHTTYERELELKQSILAETLERIGKIKPCLLPPVPARNPEYYRSFVQLKIDAQGRIGLFRRDSHDVMPFEGEGFNGCRLQQDRLNRAVDSLQGKLAGFQVIKMRAGDEGFLVNLTHREGHGPGDTTPPLDDITEAVRKIGADGLLVNDHPVFGSSAALYIYGEAEGGLGHPERRFRVSYDSFFQSDPEVVRHICDRIGQVLHEVFGPDRLMQNILDLYAGVGTFGILLAPKVLGVFAVEISNSAANDMDFNISANHITNLLYHRSTAKSFLKRFRGPVGAVVVDPPRAGLELDIIHSLRQMSPPLVFYVSCHPATLARDLAAFTRDGAYGIDSVQIFDQFGRTHHIESLTVLKHARLNAEGG